MDMLMWLYYAAAGWYVAYVISNPNVKGPWGIFEWVRKHLPLGGLTSCIICLLPWAVLILRLIGVNIITDVFAIAAVALWLHGYTGWRHNIT